MTTKIHSTDCSIFKTIEETRGDELSQIVMINHLYPNDKIPRLVTDDAAQLSYQLTKLLTDFQTNVSYRRIDPKHDHAHYIHNGHIRLSLEVHIKVPESSRRLFSALFNLRSDTGETLGMLRSRVFDFLLLNNPTDAEHLGQFQMVGDARLVNIKLEESEGNNPQRLFTVRLNIKGHTSRELNHQTLPRVLSYITKAKLEQQERKRHHEQSL